MKRTSSSRVLTMLAPIDRKGVVALIPYNESFLVSQFREFYTEVIQLKRLVTREGWVSPPENGSGNGNGSSNEAGTWVYFPETNPTKSVALQKTGKIQTLGPTGALPDLTTIITPEPPQPSEQSRTSLFVWQSLMAMFRRNAKQVMSLNGAPTESYFEAQYLMAAFADEVFIHANWEGSRTWTSNLLESALFHSHVAGELFFEKLDRLLRERDPVNRSLAAVYLTALSLGFRGKYRGVNDHGQLRKYRQELFAFVFNHTTELQKESKVAFPEAYTHSLKKQLKKKMTHPKLWLGVLGLVFLSYLAVSHGLWLSLTSRLNDANKQIVEIRNRLDSISVKR